MNESASRFQRFFADLWHRVYFQMPLEIVAGDDLRIVFAADLVLGPLTVIWHAGEPLAMPISYYERGV